MGADDPDPEELIRQAIDLIALSYPFDRSEAEKAEWLAAFRATMEDRAPVARARMRGAIRSE